MLKNNRKKGVTLIELVIALGIMAIVTSLIFFFYFSNEKQLNRVEIKSNLQYEAKSFTESISKFAMEANSATWDNNKLSFTLVTDKGEKLLEGAVFSINKESRIITLQEQGKESKEICNDVKSIDITISEDKIKIILILEKKGVEYKVEESYVFRNSHLK